MKKISIIAASLLVIFGASHAFGATTFIVQQGGTGQFSFTSSKLLYGAGTGALQSVATTSATCSGSASCTPFTVIGASPITISATGIGTVSTSSSETSGRIPFWTSTAATPALLSGGSSSLTFDGTTFSTTYASTTLLSAETVYAATGNLFLRAIGDAGAISILGSAAASAATAGGSLFLVPGDGLTSGAGGSTAVVGGNGGATGNGGQVIIQTGQGGATSGNGGALTLRPGAGSAAANSVGGNLILEGGYGNLGTDGLIKLRKNNLSSVFGIFDLASIASSDKTYTFPNLTGTFVLGSGTKGQLSYWNNTNSLTSVATTSVTCSGGATCTSFTAIGSSPITISATTGTGSVATSTNEVANQVAVFSSNSATPATIAGYPTYTWDNSNSLLSVLGNATTTQFTSTSTTYLATTAGSLVGVGTTTPWGQLSINPTATNGSAPSFVVGSTTGTLFKINSAGSVAIGTSTDSVYGLTVSNRNNLSCAYLGPWDANNSWAALNLNCNTGAGNYNFLSSRTQTTQTLYINRPTGGDIAFRENNAVPEQLILRTGGNVGIGTSTPNWAFQVAGTRPSIALSDTNQTAVSNKQHWLFSSMGGNLYVGTSTGVFATSTPAALSILNDGTVSFQKALGVGSGGTGQSTFTSSQLLYGNTTNALSSVATTSIAFTSFPATLAGTLGALVGGANSTLTWWGLATTSALTQGQLLYNTTGGNGVASVATTSVTAGTGVTFGGTAGALVGGAALTINTPWAVSGTTISSSTATAVGIGTTTPNWLLQVAGTRPSFALSDTGAGGVNLKHWLFSSMGGELYIGTSSDTYATSTRPALSISNSGQVNTYSVQPATSTAMTLNWNSTPNQVEYRIGTAATTISLINATTSTNWGSRKLVWVCNPGSVAGALTWAGVEWVGTAPVQTTTAGQCDAYSFDVLMATSSSAFKVSGTAGTGLQ